LHGGFRIRKKFIYVFVWWLNIRVYIWDMNNAQNNKGFLQSSSATLRNSILDNIANHYGVTRDVIYQELTTGTPEDVMEYVTVDRPAVHFMYKAYMGAL